MQNKKIILLLLTLILIGTGVVGAEGQEEQTWSKIQKVGQIAGQATPLEIIQEADRMIGVYNDLPQKEMRIFQVKWEKGKAEISDLVNYQYNAHYALDHQIFALEDGYGVVWREKDQQEGHYLHLTLFNQEGTLQYDKVFYELNIEDARITDLDIYARGSEIQLIWVEKHEVRRKQESRLFKQTWQVNLFDAESNEAQMIRDRETMNQPHLVEIEGGQLVIVLKEDVRRTYYFNVLDLEGKLYGKMGLAINELYLDWKTKRDYAELDSGIQAVYDPQGKRLIGNWIGKDPRARIENTPATSPMVGILEMGANKPERYPVINFRSRSHFTNLAIGPTGEVKFVWSDHLKGTYQIYHSNLDYVLSPENTAEVDGLEDVPVQIVSPPGFGAWYPKLLIDDQGREHLFWWETVKGGYKLLYRNDQSKVPMALFSKLGLNPELDTFSVRQGVVQTFILALLAILVGGFFTMINLTNFVLVIGFFSLLSKWGWQKSFRKHSGLILAGVMLTLWLIQSPANPLYYQVHEQIGYYFYGGVVATLFVLVYQKLRQVRIWEVLGMLEVLVIWSFWQHLFLVIPHIFQWVQ